MSPGFVTVFDQRAARSRYTRLAVVRDTSSITTVRVRSLSTADLLLTVAPLALDKAAAICSGLFCHASERHQPRQWAGMSNPDTDVLSTYVHKEALFTLITLSQGSRSAMAHRHDRAPGQRIDLRGACATDQCARGLAARTLAAGCLLNRVWAPSSYQH